MTSECFHCGGHIEFDEDAAGADEVCPHCGLVTRLQPGLVRRQPEIPREGAAPLEPPATTSVHLAEIKFACPYCHQRMSVGGEEAGVVVRCAGCGVGVRVPADLQTSTASAPTGKPAPFRGPPYECAHCGGTLIVDKRRPNRGAGCIIVILGLCLTPLLIGIPIIIYGLWHGDYWEKWWVCSKCGAQVPVT